jgi:hypothetical protein
LSASDPTYSRIDVVAVNNLGQVVVLEGTPGVDLQQPTTDPATQLDLTYIIVTANSTEPGGITYEVVYNENIE